MLTEPEIKELEEKNIGFQFLHDPRQMRSGAVLFLQWCLAPQAAMYMRENEVRNAKVFITSVSPNGNETRVVASFASSPQVFLEFYRSGTHIVWGTVVWGDEVREAEKLFLVKAVRYSYMHSLERVVRYKHCQSFGHAEISVEVSANFFAPEPSAWEKWYINLWFKDPAWDQCGLRKQRAVAYFVQTPILAIWIPYLLLVRLVIALWFSFFLARREVPWMAVLQPFEYRTGSLWDDSSGYMADRYGAWVLYEKDGKPRKSQAFLWPLVPLTQVPFLLFSLFITAAFVGLSWGNFVLVHAVVLACVITIPFVFPMFADVLLSGLERTAQVSAQRRMDRAYNDLLCTTAPPVGGLRTTRRGVVNTVVLAFHSAKASVCRPVARG